MEIMKADNEVETDVKTRFADVEGIDAARQELEEIVDFLKNPDKYSIMGAKIPRVVFSPCTGMWQDFAREGHRG